VPNDQVPALNEFNACAVGYEKADETFRRNAKRLNSNERYTQSNLIIRRIALRLWGASISREQWLPRSKDSEFHWDRKHRPEATASRYSPLPTVTS